VPDWLHNALNTTWQLLWIVYPIFIGGLVLERIFPAERGQPWKHIGFNFLYAPVFFLLTSLALPPLHAITAPWIQSAGGWMPVRLPDSPWGLVALGLVYMAIYDFFYYWFHRAQHTFKPLWAQHKLHHSDVSLNVSTSGRHHWLEEPLRVFLMMLPMAIIFDVTAPQAGWIATALLLWPFFIHLNVRLPLGPLTPVLGGPQLHRIHHSREPQHHDRNYAAFFPIWDILFGTYCAPKRGEYPRTGLDSGEDLNTWRGALFSPFGEVWRMLRRPRPTASATEPSAHPQRGEV
jgi:sterol desaturase/sphingolipid hydroxylase (fatty acid hydroxylase superfamily)